MEMKSKVQLVDIRYLNAVVGTTSLDKVRNGLVLTELEVELMFRRSIKTLILNTKC